MEKIISKGDRDIHIRSVVKSNLVGFGLSNVDIDFITENMTSDLLDVLDNYRCVNSSESIFNGEF